MSSMLEQAIIDAAALREAALKNAEQSLIEKYAPQIKEAVESMLNETNSKMKYEGKTVEVVHEADAEGMVTVSEAGGKPFVVNESELSTLTEDEILQEEEMGAETAAAEATSSPIDAPFAGNPNMPEDREVNFSIDVETLDDEIDINLDDLERELTDQEMAADELNSIGDMAADLEMQDTEMDDVLGGEEEQEGAEDAELQLQELLDLLDGAGVLEEEIEVDMREDKDGTFDTNESSLEYKKDKQEARDAHHPEEEEPDDDGEQEDLQETINLLMTQNSDLESIVYKLNDKLEETLLSNAKLLYQNRTLCDASLNERQKNKIVEAIAKAESPKEAKQLHETLTTTVGSNQKKGPQSLSESVNNRSNLSGIINRRQNLNESKTVDPFMEKMRKLAGIK